jgi:hypothetical protein
MFSWSCIGDTGDRLMNRHVITQPIAVVSRSERDTYQVQVPGLVATTQSGVAHE